MKSKSILLSICIPTYGRPIYTLQTLHSIVSEMSDVTELVIVDDGSKDGTFEIIELFKKAYPHKNISIEQNRSNLGFDKNVLKVMSKGNGKYLWLFGNDDIMNPGSLSYLLNIIRKNPKVSLIHTNYSRFDNVLKKITAKKMVSGINKDIYFTDYINFYFRKIQNSYFKYLGTNTITMSTNIIRRSEWEKASQNIGKFIGHNFIHSFIIGKVIHDNQNIIFIAKPLVQYLANNHRLWPNDIWKEYNSVLLDYLLEIGYPKNKITEMKNVQKTYENSEALMKMNLIKYTYKFFAPLISRYRQYKDSLTSNV